MPVSPLARTFCLPGLFLVLVGLLVGNPAVARVEPPNPRLSLPASRLGRPFEEPVFLTGHLGFGGGFQFDQGLPAYGASLVFRPGSAASFLDFLYDLNSAMVLRIDYQRITTDADRMLSADLILRRYFADRGTAETEVLPFVGLGIGSTDVTVPQEAGGGNSRYWSWLVEVGQEWYFSPRYVVIARAQYRRHSYGDFLVSTWTVSGAIGIPVPW